MPGRSATATCGSSPSITGRPAGTRTRFRYRSTAIAGWPALALLIAVKLLTGMLNRPVATSPPAADNDALDEVTLPVVPGLTQPVPVKSAGAPVTTPPLNRRLASSSGQNLALRAQQALDIAELLPAARVVRDELHYDGRRLTRDALAASLRENGHPIRNSRLTSLLQALRSESETNLNLRG